jgi:hypothetical protein
VSAGYTRLSAGLVLELLSLDDLGFTLGGLSVAKSSAKKRERRKNQSANNFTRHENEQDESVLGEKRKRKTHHALHAQHAPDLLLRMSALFQFFGLLERRSVGVSDTVRVRMTSPNGRGVGVGVGVVTVGPVIGTRRSADPTVGPSQTGPTTPSVASDQASPIRPGQTGGPVVPSQTRTRMSASTVRVVEASPGVSAVGPSQSRPGVGRSAVRPGQTRSRDIGRMKTSSTMGTVVARQTRTSVGTVRTRKTGPRVSSVRTGKPSPVSLVQVVRLSSDRVKNNPSRVGVRSMNTMGTVSAGSTVRARGRVGVVTGEEVGSGSPELGRVRFTVFIVHRRA